MYVFVILLLLFSLIFKSVLRLRLLFACVFVGFISFLISFVDDFERKTTKCKNSHLPHVLVLDSITISVNVAVPAPARARATACVDNNNGVVYSSTYSQQWHTSISLIRFVFCILFCSVCLPLHDPGIHSSMHSFVLLLLLHSSCCCFV